MSTRKAYNVLRSAIVVGFLLWAGAIAAQDAAKPAESSSDSSLRDSVLELRQQIRDLRAAVGEIRQDSERYRAETAELRKELAAVRASAVSNGSGSQVPEAVADSSYITSAPEVSNPSLEAQKTQRAASLDEEYQL